jgi:spore germination protein KB
LKIRITNGMLAALVMTLIYAKAIGLTQGIMAREVYGDTWLSTIFATFQGMAIMALTVYLIKRRPDKNILQQADLIFGKWVGRGLGLVMFLFFLGAFSTVSIVFVYHLMDYFLPEAPTWVFFAIGLSVCLYGLFLGLEVIARAAFLGVLSMILFNILVIFGSFRQMDIQELHPLFQSGLLKTLWASRHNDTDWVMATLMVSLLLPQVNERKEWGKAATVGILLAGIIIVLWPILEVTVLTPEMTAQYIVSCMQLARSVEIGVFMQRYEMIMVAMFIVPLFVQLMMCLYCATKGLSHSFGDMKWMKLLYVPVALISGVFSYWIVDDHMRAVDYLTDIWPFISLSFGFGLPLLLLIGGAIGSKRLQR